MELDGVEYVQIRTPDTTRLAELLNYAKGPKRTMAQLAEECGLTTSMLSRIVNSKIVKPLSLEVLKKIYDCQDPDSEIPFSYYIECNGMIEKNELEEKRAAGGSIFERRNERENLEIQMKNIIMGELFDRGVPIVRACASRRINRESDVSAVYPFRLGDCTLEFTGDDGSYHWGLFFYTGKHGDTTSHKGNESRALLRSLLIKYHDLFLLDAWMKEVLTDYKLSFVFCDRIVFDRFRHFIREMPVNSYISAILVNTDCGRVVSEELMGKCEGRSSIFNAPPTDEEDSDGEDEFTREDNVRADNTNE